MVAPLSPLASPIFMVAASLLLVNNPLFVKLEVEEPPAKFKAGPEELICIVPLLPITRVLSVPLMV
ncbi:hypothetical protein [Campylobacter jejuni]|uniref:hypothetical protein n=1 Tax=Campylobacter jejuni TaxID=197 RepID=UPI003BA44B27